MKVICLCKKNRKTCKYPYTPQHVTMHGVDSYVIFHIPAIPQAPKLPKTTWVDKIRTAVLTLMYMNHRLYKHLYSATFDVPDYEKENILYNNEVSILIHFNGKQRYFTTGQLPKVLSGYVLLTFLLS